MPDRITKPLLRVVEALADDPGQEWYGLELMEAARLSSGTLYPILHRLVADGWLERTRDVPSDRGGTGRRMYKLTGHGALVSRARAAVVASATSFRRAPSPHSGTTRMTSAVLVMGGFGVALFLKNVLEPLLTSEILGGFDDLLKRRVHRAAALLPTELATDQEDEWLMELAALGARRARALLFTRGLASAAAVIAGAKDAAQPTRDGPAPHGDETPEEVHQVPAPGSRARKVVQTSRVPAGLALMLRTQDEVITVTNDRDEPLNIQLIDGEVYVASMSDPERWSAGPAGIAVERRLRPPTVRRAPLRTAPALPGLGSSGRPAATQERCERGSENPDRSFC